jgi:uncharacterized protein YcbK (DUF882 family)
MLLKGRDTTVDAQPSRRRAIAVFAGAALGLAFKPSGLAAAPTASPVARSLDFWHTHTHENLSVAFADSTGYRAAALGQINSFLRDFRTREVHDIDPKLLDLLHRLAGELDAPEPFHVISGYRSPRTNSTLRSKSGGVARYSLHMEGKAIDIRLPGVPLARLKEAALDLKLGGVGYYPGSDFVHVDTGRVRAW